MSLVGKNLTTGLPTHLNNDPLSGRRRVHERHKQCPELLDNLAGNVEEEWQISPGDPFRLRSKRI